MIAVSGEFWRILFADRAQFVLLLFRNTQSSGPERRDASNLTMPGKHPSFRTMFNGAHIVVYPGPGLSAFISRGVPAPFECALI